VPAVQVPGARVRAGALAAFQAGGVCLGGGPLRGQGAVAGQHRLARVPVLARGGPRPRAAPRGLPEIFELSTVSAHVNYVSAGHIVVCEIRVNLISPHGVIDRDARVSPPLTGCCFGCQALEETILVSRLSRDSQHRLWLEADEVIRDGSRKRTACINV
jgi:hypothetical protein